MRIYKILNNNAVIVKDGGVEKIAIGPGIAFNKQRNDVINPKKIEKLFVMEENEKLQQLLKRIPEEHFLISETIISYAEKQMDTKLSEHIHIQLTDHISFAIERIKEGIHLRNKLLNEIKILYKKEFTIGLWAIDYIKQHLQIEMDENEAAFIALHLHTAKQKGTDLKDAIRQTTIIQDMVKTIKSLVQIDVQEDDLAYHRLITHLRYALARTNKYEIRTLDDEITEMIQKKLPFANHCAHVLAKNVAEKYDIHFSEQELAYITLHIERLRKK
ncbi:PRD domain-containing protein [Fervidibacillus halotolerans]|uniref:PRD domain-containing protein n=1 Tax=Fervidibacillus halotolerans TaxID=2980027 RepID=A0A9E8LZW5_9BACI|nr:PRD domain-containing protein [Fervidibacillus halotolerans]WAA12056.1 PRD domain-containing protein [Fervidibacillus halotolerans]